MLSNYLREELWVLPEGEGILERLEEGDVRELLKLAEEYFKRAG